MKKFASLLLMSFLIFTLASGTVFASGTATNKDKTEMNSYIEDVLGVKYKYGGTSAKTGFDCSGFVIHVFKKMGYTDLDRRSADMAKQGTKVAKDELIPGDLVFFDTSGSNNGGITHVGIYVGNGQFAHASSSKGVRYDSLDSKYYKPRYVTARRVLSEKDYVAYATVKPVVEETTETTVASAVEVATIAKEAAPTNTTVALVTE